MKRLMLLAATVAVLFALVLIVAPLGAEMQSAAHRRRAGVIGAGFALLNSDFAGVRGDIRGFVPTGSDSHICFLTLLESNHADLVKSAWCGRRTLDGHEGVFVHVFLTEPPPSDLILLLAVYQDLAKEYGPPVLYPDSSQ